MPPKKDDYETACSTLDAILTEMELDGAKNKRRAVRIDELVTIISEGPPTKESEDGRQNMP